MAMICCRNNVVVGLLGGPKYDGDNLRSIVRTLLMNLTMSQILTNVIIPTFDIRTLQQVIFSKDDARANGTTKNAKLSDVIISTTAAPTFFPLYYFETKDAKGTVRPFNMIDGGVAANNPTLAAITQLSKRIKTSDFQSVDRRPMESDKMMVLSLGTGAAKFAEKYRRRRQQHGGFLVGYTTRVKLHCWIFSPVQVPTWWTFMSPRFFQSLRSDQNYLRVQEDSLVGDEFSVDVATPLNMQRLLEIGNAPLKKPVSRVNLDTGRYEAVPGAGTNEQAQTKFAKLLSDERKLRKSK